jgi:hypothetical protein
MEVVESFEETEDLLFRSAINFATKLATAATTALPQQAHPECSKGLTSSSIPPQRHKRSRHPYSFHIRSFNLTEVSGKCATI